MIRELGPTMIPSISEINRLHARLCSGISDPIRITILYALAEEPRNVTRLTEALGLPQSTVSRHLAVLRQTGLVVTERDGRQVDYMLTDDRVIEALDILRSILQDRVNKEADLLSDLPSD